MELYSIRRMKIIIIIMATILISPLIMGNTTKLYPSDDAFVRDKTPSTNFGTGDWRSNLRIGYQASFGTDKSYLKFNLNSLQGKTINSAVFSIERLGSEANPNLNLYSVSTNAWGEDTITWSNAPSTNALIGSIAVSNQDRIEFNISGSYLGASEVSFAIVEDGGSGFVNSFSKDLNTGGGDEVFWPYLEVDYSEGKGLVCPSENYSNICCALNPIEMMNFINKFNHFETTHNPIEMMNFINKFNHFEPLC